MMSNAGGVTTKTSFLGPSNLNSPACPAKRKVMRNVMIRVPLTNYAREVVPSHDMLRVSCKLGRRGLATGLVDAGRVMSRLLHGSDQIGSACGSHRVVVLMVICRSCVRVGP